MGYYNPKTRDTIWVGSFDELCSRKDEIKCDYNFYVKMLRIVNKNNSNSRIVGIIKDKINELEDSYSKMRVIPIPKAKQ